MAMKMFAKTCIAVLALALAGQTATAAPFGRDPTDTIVWFYRHYLRRNPTPFEVNAHLNALRLGSSLRDVEAVFLASPEYYRLQGGTPVSWIQGLYQDVLGRPGNATEIGFWLDRFRALGGNRILLAQEYVAAADAFRPRLSPWERPFFPVPPPNRYPVGW
jgi:hypothetical protein